ncbi:MAG: YfhO family protein [Patescibacteria group bacterium]|nr:YfhO family protein [Patescibacteria group bacterium]MCL6096587.1 YfhO family protein [Patescibacteria group bacterium]
MHLPGTKKLLIIISLILIIIPFFWLKPGEMDLGGDASRLYFYDPGAYIKNLPIWTISPQGTGPEFSYQFSLPFIFLLLILKTILQSPWLLITVFNSISLVVSFLAMYGVVIELLKKEKINSNTQRLMRYSAIFASLFYLFMPISVYGGWDRALFDHTQIFINPLIIFLLIKYINSLKIKYILIALLTSFIFSHNFSYSSAPKFFAFFPIVLLYLGIYAFYIKKIKLPIKKLIVIIILFLGLHSFHLIPTISDSLKPSSLAYFKISESGRLDAINFFESIAQYVRTSDNLMGLAPKVTSLYGFDVIFIIFPLIFTIGAIFNKRFRSEKDQAKNFLLIFVFFLITLFFISANITKIGFRFYKSLFNIPGFSMFRSFFGQWAHVYIFFYSLLIGFAFYYILVNFKGLKRFAIYSGVFILIVVSGLPLIKGEVVNSILTKSSGVAVGVPILMDQEYERVLNFIKNEPTDTKFITFPMTDYFYQILGGKSGGAYLGPSTISYLTGKKDFAGYQILQPLSEVFENYVKLKDYNSIVRLFGILNIKYILYNSDPYILNNFLDFPYQHMRTFLPGDQKSYGEFIRKLEASELKNFANKYFIYGISQNLYLPHIYVAEEIIFSDLNFNEAGYVNKKFFGEMKNKKIRNAYLDKKISSKLKDRKLAVPKITFTKVNPTKYIIRIEKTRDPYLLIFSESFNSDWKLFLSSEKKPFQGKVSEYFNGDITETEHRNAFLDFYTFETIGKKPVADESHMLVNGYANSWYITPSDAQKKSSYSLILEMTSQRLFYLSFFISSVAFVVCLVWLIMVLSKLKE